jgi:hypothetical protein
MLCAHVALLTTSQRPDAEYATSERDTKKTRRADTDCATSEHDAKRARRADTDYVTSERDAKRARRADADKKVIQPTKYYSGLIFLSSMYVDLEW